MQISCAFHSLRQVQRMQQTSSRHSSRWLPKLKRGSARLHRRRPVHKQISRSTRALQLTSSHHLDVAEIYQSCVWCSTSTVSLSSYFKHRCTGQFFKGAEPFLAPKYFDSTRKTAYLTLPKCMLSTNWNGLYWRDNILLFHSNMFCRTHPSE